MRAFYLDKGLSVGMRLALKHSLDPSSEAPVSCRYVEFRSLHLSFCVPATNGWHDRASGSTLLERATETANDIMRVLEALGTKEHT